MTSPLNTAKSQPLLPADSIVQALETWFLTHGKSYPWRETHDPYAIAVSELMLQQTQIKAVLDKGYYARWMTAFPDLATLAAASEEQVLSVWQGLGYYRRARFLQSIAKTILQEYHGVFPTEAALIRKLPGIGDYTTGAIMSFAFDQPLALVDGNVARVLSRLCNDDTPIDTTEGQKILWSRASALLEFAKSPRIHNSALMELGQQICRPGMPLCSECPLQSWCKAISPEKLPIKSKKQSMTELQEHVAWIFRNDTILLQQETGARRKGLWKLPALQLPTEPTSPILTSQYTITRYKVTLHVHEGNEVQLCPEQMKAPQRWVSKSEMKDLPMPSPYRRAAEKLWRQQNSHETGFLNLNLSHKS